MARKGAIVPPGKGSMPNGSPTVCPHCWMVNPGAFRLCGRCGADMHTILQESGGLRRVAPIQSPVPVGASRRLRTSQRVILGAFVALLAAWYLAPLIFGVRAPARSTPPSAAQGY